MNKALKIAKERFPGKKFQEAIIINQFNKIEKPEDNITVKILTIIGGLLSGLAFSIFFTITSLWVNGETLIIIALFTIATAVFINTKIHKLLLDTFSIVLYITGLAMLITGMNTIKIPENTIIVLIFFIGLITLIVNRSYILSFISVLVINGSFFSFLLYNKVKNAIVIYLIINLMFILLLFFNQAKIYSFKNKISNLYGSYRIAFIFSFLIGMILLSFNSFTKTGTYSWYGLAVIFSVSFLFVVYRIIKILEIQNKKYLVLIYTLSVLISGFSVFSPMIIGSLILILLGFYVKNRVIFTTGILSFIYFAGKFYYDLNQTLLFKSLLLIGLGIIFLAFYLFIVKNTKIEKI